MRGLVGTFHFKPKYVSAGLMILKMLTLSLYHISSDLDLNFKVWENHGRKTRRRIEGTTMRLVKGTRKVGTWAFRAPDLVPLVPP